MPTKVHRNSARAWLLAARPKTLTGAMIPVLVGTSLAFADGRLQVVPALLCLLFACGMQTAANFINDLFDYLHGTDREDRLGPERACAQGWITPAAMKRGIAAVIAVACLCGLGIVWYGRSAYPCAGWELMAVGALCVLFAFLYTTVLSYQGWGDLLVLLFFGFVPVCVTYYVQTYTLTVDTIVASLVVGLVTDALLVINNYRDREQDALSGKRTLVVRFGEPFGRVLYLTLGIVAMLLCSWFMSESPAAVVTIFYLFLHIRTWKRMVSIGSGKALNRILGETSRNMLVMGILLSLAIIL